MADLENRFRRCQGDCPFSDDRCLPRDVFWWCAAIGVALVASALAVGIVGWLA